MPITPSAGQTVNVYAGLTGTLPVSVSGNVTISGTVAVSQTNQQGMTSGAPVWVTGAITQNNTGVGITASITLPVSATNPITASVANWPTTFPGNANITASITLPVSATNPVSASILNWPTTFPGNANITASITLPVSQTNVPATQSVWVANSQGSNVNITGSIPLPISGATFQSGGLEVWVLNQTSSSLSGVGITSGALDVYVINSQGSNVNVTASIPLTVTSTQANPVWITGSGLGGGITASVSVYVDGAGNPAQTGTFATASYSTSSFLLLAANVRRAGYSVYNSSSAELFLGVTSTLTTESFSYRVAARSVFEQPPPNFLGDVYGVWAGGGAGAAMVTEYAGDTASFTPLYVTSTQANPVWVSGTFAATFTPPPVTEISGAVNITASITLPVQITGALAVVDPNNSTTATLTASQAFTGSWTDLLGYASVAYSIQSDVTSSVGGIIRQWSQDTTSSIAWDADSLSADRTGSDNGTDMVVRPHARYFRIIYQNGSAPQGFFRLQTVLGRYIPQGDTIGVAHAPVAGNDALLTKAVITGKTTAGGTSYVDVKVSPAGAVQVGGAVDVGITSSITLPVSATNPVTASVSNWPAAFPGDANITASITLPVSATNVVSSTLVGQTVWLSASVVGGSSSSYGWVTASGSATLLRAAAANRKGITFYNSGTSAAYVYLGNDAWASTTKFTCVVGSGGYYEAPYGWTGQVSAIWVSNGGSGSVTEVF